MKTNRLLIILPLAFTACDVVQYETRWQPETPEERKAVAELTLKLCEASNPKSDEEPEDMIIQAEKTAKAILCKPRRWKWDGKQWSPMELLQLQPEVERP